WIYPAIGDLPLAYVDNLAVKPLVEQMCASLSPRTVNKYGSLSAATLSGSNDISAHPRQHEALHKRGSEPVRPLQSNRRREHVTCAFTLGKEFVHESRGWSLSPQERKISALTSQNKESLMKNLAVFFALLVATTAPAVHAQGGSTAQQQPPTLASVLNMQYGLVEQQVI